ncbi:MAG TPA: HEAT repeat domain-containing protein [Reyranella sp.]|nr:HEAT repeat domain-containing protein [Reyranella sp.]
MAAATASYDSLLAELAIPHRAKYAYRELLKRRLASWPAVRRGLRHANADVRYWCCQYLDRFLEPESLAELISMLDDPDARVRVSTLHTLSCDRCKEGDCRPEQKDVLPRAMCLLARDPDAHVRAHAVGLVGQWVHTNAEALAAIARAIEADSSPAVRKKAKWYAPGGARYERTRPAA